jgi:hypothetical protein
VRRISKISAEKTRESASLLVGVRATLVLAMEKKS